MHGKLVCKCKHDDLGTIMCYKVRYVVKGYAQCYGVDYDKMTAPTAHLESFCLVLHLVVSLDWDLHQFNIKTAFLNGVLPEDEIAYMEQLSGFEEPGKEDWVWKLMCSIYSMKQASCIWNHTFDETIQSWGFHHITNEWCVYICVFNSGMTIFALHVDNILSTSSSAAETDRFKAELQSCWEISDLGPTKFALGISIMHCLKHHTISINQSTFIDHILTKFNQTTAHPCDTHMAIGLVLQCPDKLIPTDLSTIEWMQHTLYCELMGSLNYLAIAMCPNIAFVVSHLASFLDCYHTEHWTVAICVLHYVKGTWDLALVLGSNHVASLTGYSDSDYANCPDTSHSISGYCFTLGSGVISWSSKKQSHTADSLCYVEYIALHHASKELLFLHDLLTDLGFSTSGPTPLHCDNDAACLLAEDHSHHANMKHICVKYHSIHDTIVECLAHLTHVKSSDNCVDIFIKSLAKVDFEHLCSALGLHPTSLMCVRRRSTQKCTHMSWFRRSSGEAYYPSFIHFHFYYYSPLFPITIWLLSIFIHLYFYYLLS